MLLVSATTPNSCKLAVYECEVAVKKAPYFFLLSHHLGEKNQRGSGSGDAVHTVKTHSRDLSHACGRFNLEKSLVNPMKLPFYVCRGSRGLVYLHKKVL